MCCDTRPGHRNEPDDRRAGFTARGCVIPTESRRHPSALESNAITRHPVRIEEDHQMRETRRERCLRWQRKKKSSPPNRQAVSGENESLLYLSLFSKFPLDRTTCRTKTFPKKNWRKLFGQSFSLKPSKKEKKMNDRFR